MTENKKRLLYLFGYSPRKSEEIKTLKEFIEIQVQQNISINIVFIQDGVISIAQKELKNETLNQIFQLNNSYVKFYAIKEDLIARGLNSFNHSGIKKINYEELVDLMIIADSVISWT